MTTIDPQITLGDLVTEHPNLARQLERLDLDYCCHGNRSLHDAATAAGLDVDEVVKQLETSEVPGERADWADMGMAELVRHVEDTHHHYLWEELPRVSMLVDKIAQVHGVRHPELATVASTYAQLRVSLEPHLRREELRVFPTIARLGEQSDPELPGLLDRLMAEHEDAGQLFEKLRALTNNYETPADGCNTYRAAMDGLAEIERDTHEHIHKENNVLFPRALAVNEAS